MTDAARFATAIQQAALALKRPTVVAPERMQMRNVGFVAAFSQAGDRIPQSLLASLNIVPTEIDPAKAALCQKLREDNATQSAVLRTKIAMMKQKHGLAPKAAEAELVPASSMSLPNAKFQTQKTLQLA